LFNNFIWGYALRPYQIKAVEAFHAGGAVSGGSGVIVLPCGAGKTAIGIAAMVKLGCQTLILATNTTSVRQWIDELLDKTDLTPDQVGEYTGELKQIRPVTVTTYQILTYRPGRDEDFPHFALFNRGDWGLIIYDEVHLLPAPVFRVTAEIQARRRLGLTATLVREDGREEDVFSLIGPRKYDVPWKILEAQGWIATAQCSEVRIDLPESLRLEYAIADDREKYRVASVNPAKDDVVVALLKRHGDDRVLVIGQYLDQLERLSRTLGAALITGKVPHRDREKLFDEFRDGTRSLLVVSKVANFSVDLPDANVAIQVSGTFGSRQEEAQRLGRILRPKKDGSIANFYTLVTHDTKDQDFSTNRQLFLTEQGYRYNIVDAATILPELLERLAKMQAEFEEQKANGLDLAALRAKANSRGKNNGDEEEEKPKTRGRKKKVAGEEQPAEAAMSADVAAGAEDQRPEHPRRGRPPKNSSGRNHLRLVK
jgi:DNA excision repair protein ERCC-3